MEIDGRVDGIDGRVDETDGRVDEIAVRVEVRQSAWLSSVNWAKADLSAFSDRVCSH